MKLYLDTCCWGRKRDDHSVARNAAESVAVEGVISLCRIAGGIIIGSVVVTTEFRQNPDVAGRSADMVFFRRTVNSFEDLTAEDVDRARELHAEGLGGMDSLHLAIAERAGADTLITVDKKFLNAAKKKNLSRVKVINPATFLQEVISGYGI